MAYKISIIGTGNVAWHLVKTLDAAGHTILQVYGRNADKAQQLAAPYNAQVVQEIRLLSDKTDILLLCISDDGITQLAPQLTHFRCLIAHTAGGVDMEALKNTSPYYGVLWPLQTLSAGKKVNFMEVPLCIEGSNRAAEMQLQALADSISNRVHFINSEKRKHLHLAAVFANNFTNAMYTLAAEIVEKQGIDFSLLRPLIKETAEKVQHLLPADAQTGPAKRHDEETIQQHLQLLTQGSAQEAAYRLLTDIIQQHNQK